MLEGLDKINWSELHHAYGEASDVPENIRALLSADKDTREKALWGLFNTISHQGTIYEASSYAVPFLYELIQSPQTPDKVGVVELLLFIGKLKSQKDLVYDEADEKAFREQATKLGLDWEEEEQKRKRAYDLTCSEVGKKLPLLLSFIDDPYLKWSFVETLPNYPEYSVETIPLLEKLLVDEKDEQMIQAINEGINSLKGKRNL